MKKLYVVALAMVVASCAVAPSNGDDRPDQSRAWYLEHNKAGLPSGDIRPLAIGRHVRQAFRVDPVEASRENSWIVWVSAWPKPGARQAKAYVDYLTIEGVAPLNSAIPIYTQRYVAGDVVWGGWFPFNDNQWYQLGMRQEHDFEIGPYVENGENRFVGAILDIGGHANLPAAGHIWQKRWPRDLAPTGAQRMRMRARFVVTGDAFINVGMDRFRLADADPQPTQEMLVSDTYDASHGIVEVMLETPVITWKP